MRALALSLLPKFREIRPKLRLPEGGFSFNPEPMYRKIAYTLTRWVYRPHYIGFENVPKSGAAILIANHVSYMDGPIIDAGLYATCGRTARYLIDEDIYNTPGVHYIMKMD